MDNRFDLVTKLLRPSLPNDLFEPLKARSDRLYRNLLLLVYSAMTELKDVFVL